MRLVSLEQRPSGIRNKCKAASAVKTWVSAEEMNLSKYYYLIPLNKWHFFLKLNLFHFWVYSIVLEYASKRGRKNKK